MRPVLVWLVLIALPASAMPSSASVREPTLPSGKRSTEQLSELASGPGEVVLVMPLVRGEGWEQPDWLGDGAARYLAEALGLAGYRVVDEEDRAAAIREAGLAASSRLPRASALVLARQVGARYVVTGRWSVQTGRIRLSVLAMDALRLSLVREIAVDAVTPEAALAQVAEQLTGDAGQVPGVRLELGELARTNPAALVSWLQAAAEPEQAVEHLSAALEIEPSFEPARLALAWALLDAGSQEELPRVLDGIAGSSVRHRRAAANALEGRLALALGDQDQAVRSLSAAARELPSTSTLVWLAEAQLAAGDSESAGRTVRQALAQSPSDEAALELQARASTVDSPP